MYNSIPLIHILTIFYNMILFVMLNCVFVTFPCGILGQVWLSDVLIHDLCRISYFYDSEAIGWTYRHLKRSTVRDQNTELHRTWV